MGCVAGKAKLGRNKVRTVSEDREEEEEGEGEEEVRIINKLSQSYERKFYKLFAIQEVEAIKENSVSYIT